MATIQTSIKLNDSFSNVLYGIINSVNLGLSAMADLQESLNAEVDPSGLQGARDAINQATIAAGELDASLQGITAPVIEPKVTKPVISDIVQTATISTEEDFVPVYVDVEPVVPDPLIPEQEAVTVAAELVVPDPLIPEQEAVTVPVEPVLPESMNVDIGVEPVIPDPLVPEQEAVTVAVEPIVSDLLVPEQETMTVPVEPVVPDPFVPEQEAVTVPVEPVLPESMNVDIGVEPAVPDPLVPEQEAVTVPVEPVLPESMNVDIGVEPVVPDPLVPEQEAVTVPVEPVLPESMNVDIGVEPVVPDMDTLFPDGEEILIEPIAPDPLVEQPEPIEVPVSWVGDSLEVFTDTGIERFEQEIQSANSMMTVLSATQQRISEQASSMSILPADAQSDISGLNTRLQKIQQRITQIENNPLNVGSGAANAGLEQMRTQLASALQAQEALNQAVEGMDVEAANAAYLQLSSTISSTERYIRDNTTEQGEFNDAIEEGTEQANSLMSAIAGAVSAYASLRTLQAVLDQSDELISNTARVSLMVQNFNEGLSDTELSDATAETLDKIYSAANDARGSVSDMMSVVARFGNNAKDAFSSTDEVIDFANLIQKQMTIAGATTEEASNAMLQLSQALGSGTLRGDELNSIFEQAPNLIQTIADYMGISIGEIRDLASEGEITADIVKSAILGAADEINEQFESMPMTYSQAWTQITNEASYAFQEVLTYINSLLNSDVGQSALEGITNALYVLADVAMDAIGILANVISFVSENFDTLAGLLTSAAAALAAYKVVTLAYSAAATIAKIAQLGFNEAVNLNPVGLLVAAITAAITALIYFGTQAAQSAGLANTALGTVAGAVNVVIQFFVNLGLQAANIFLGIANAAGALASNMLTAFSNAISGIQSWFYDLMSTALTVISKIAAALNELPFVEFDYSGITAAAEEYAAKSAEVAAGTQDYASIGDAFSEGMNTFDTFSEGWIADAFASGAEWGDSLWENWFGSSEDITATISDYELADYSSLLSDIAESTEDTSDTASDISDALDITDEELKYLRDLAEVEAVNRFTTAEVTINQTNTNNISSEMDLDGVVSGLTDAVNEAVDELTEGVHE